MTDYFALFGQPRSAWLDPAALKNEFHRRAKTEHPDTDADSDFAALNIAYRALSDPALRLAHLLALRGQSVAAIAEPPAELSDLFFETASTMQARDHTMSQEQLAKLRTLEASTVESLRELDVRDIAAVQRTHARLMFLDRWIEQLADFELA